VKFLCVRNYFIGQKTRWTKGKYYDGREANSLERTHGIAFYIESNEESLFGVKLEYLVKKKEYPTYFKSLEDVREERIDMILGTGKNNI